MCRGNGLVAQLGAHHIRIVGVEGSNPFKSTMKESTTQRAVLSFMVDEEIRKIKCNADERCSRGLDRAKPLFSPIGKKMQTNPFKSTNKNAAFGRQFLLVDLKEFEK